jgi:AhpC/TSA family protein
MVTQGGLAESASAGRMVMGGSNSYTGKPACGARRPDGNLSNSAQVAPSRRRGMLPIGSKAPDFKVKDHTGRDVSLGEFRGKTVVLWFYPKADTPG